MARIVVVEDNAASLSLITYLLRAVGHDVEGHRDGVSALGALRCRRPDLVICDVQLPRMSGLELARELRADPALQDLPIVGVSALAMQRDHENAMAAGFTAYLEKPIQPTTFVAQVEEAMPPALRRASFLLPVATPVSNMSTSAPEGSKTILAVDDVPENLALMESICRLGGYRLITATSAQQALERLRTSPVDLVISDVHMLPVGGFTLRQLVATDQTLRTIPFLFISSTIMGDDERRRAEQLGVRRLVERPIDPKKLLEQLAECLSEQTDE